ncbi:MAG: hypothetical protein P4L73_14230 [Caulobacteraceae bacterium]|nr:hypothetical protein [Caulobacteraceae bacterium]
MTLAALILLLPAIAWGRPFVFGDTAYYWGWGGDILDAIRQPWPHPGQPWTPGRSLSGWGADLHDVTPADLRFNLTWLTARSAFYAVPFRLLAGAGGLWPVAAAQALIAAWAVKVAVRAAAPASSRLTYIAGVAALTALSSLGFEAAYAMPDVFGGLALLAAGLLIALSQRIGRAERVGLCALIVYAVLAHAENALNLAAAVAIGAIWRWRVEGEGLAALRRVAPTAAALAVGLGAAMLGGMALGAVFGRPAHMPPFAASRILADGGAQAYLRRACPDAGLAACDLAQSPPVPPEYYLWVYPLERPPLTPAPDRTRYTIDQFNRLDARHVTEAEADQRERFVGQQSRLVLGALGTDGLFEARQAITHGSVALINFGVDRNFDTIPLLIHGGRSRLRETLASILPGGVECARPQSAACGRFDLGGWVPGQYAAALAALLFLAAASLRRRTAPPEGLACLLGLTLSLVLVNALLCGAISGPYSRYQSRVEWLVPLGALLLLAEWVTRPGPAPVSGAGVPKDNQ